MLYDHPELPGEGQPEDSVVLLLVGCFWVRALWVAGCIGSPDLGSCVGHPASLKPPLNAHLHCGGIRGGSPAAGSPSVGGASRAVCASLEL